jgi:transposase InsO family protein
VSARYAFVDAEKAASGFPISRGCRLLRVSQSGFYAWRGRPESATRTRRSALLVWILRFHRASDGSYGYRKIHRDLVAAGVPASQALVRRVMRDADLHGVAPRRDKTTTIRDPQATPAPDLLERDFSCDEPGTRLVGDITYLRTWSGWAYLAVVICLATKRVVGWHVSTRPTAQLVIDALAMAQRNGELAPDAIFHTDRGTQYTSEAFARSCEEHGLRQSMGRTGVCWDNAQAETFFASLKVECVYRTALASPERARRIVGRWIETWYNRRRRHSALDYQTPNERYFELTTARAA